MNVSDEQRSGIDRRCGKDRRLAHAVDYFLNGGVERRNWKERRVQGERRQDWVRVSEWSSMFVGSTTPKRKELIIERRKYKRFGVQDGSLVVYGLHSDKVGQIIDMSMGGLAFSDTSSGDQSNGSFELDILLTDHGFYLEKVPVQTVSNLKIANEPSTVSTTTRRHGVQFKDLAQNQTSKLEYFLQKHTTREL